MRLDRLPRAKLNVCGKGSKNECNFWLNDTFERPGKPHVQVLMDDLQQVDASGTLSVTRWLIKTLLLLQHPDVIWDDKMKSSNEPWEFPAGMLPNMLATSRIPEDLSLWIGVVNRDADHATAVPTFTPKMLPMVWDDMGPLARAEHALFGFSLPNGTDLLCQLVFHPFIPIDHPLERVGLVTRLWPDPPTTLNLSTFPVLDRAGYDAFRSVFFRSESVTATPREIFWDRSRSSKV
jgi:hypothetical protein